MLVVKIFNNIKVGRNILNSTYIIYKHTKIVKSTLDFKLIISSTSFVSIYSKNKSELLKDY